MFDVNIRGVVFRARGHNNIRATHRSTMEVTTEDYLTPRGDCIVGVSAEISPARLPRELKEVISSDGSIVVAVLCSSGLCDSVVGRGSSRMTLSDDRRMVFRRSSYVGPETVMVSASKAAVDLSRDIVKALKSGNDLVVVLLAFKLESLGF
ncbi:MAG: DUF371 domain-containing protein [Acidilobaceae archaeon]